MYHSKSHPAEKKSSLKGAWSGLGEPFLNVTPRVISPLRLTLETANFVHWSAMQSLSLVMSECFVSGRGQGHVSNFYIVDLENFATASLRYTGDIHNSTVVGLFMTHCLQLNLQLHTIGLVRTCRIISFCTVAWQLARILLTRRIARSLGDSGASCYGTLSPNMDLKNFATAGRSTQTLSILFDKGGRYVWYTRPLSVELVEKHWL